MSKDDAPPAAADAPATKDAKGEEIVWGKTPRGEVFRVPTTHDVLTALFHPAYPKSHIDALNLALLGSQILLFLWLPSSVARPFFLLYFAFWRAAYDAGLGWVLTKQSKRRWIVKEVQRRGWLDAERRPAARDWIRKQLAGKMGKDYSFDELPLEYNTWLLFRQAVDIILLNDFVAYCMFSFACFRVPTDLSLAVHTMRWAGGLALIAFNLWVKTEAHDVVKDYGWYWGDVFFQRGALVFDGVFELAPHPMYSVGYAGYYGLSLIVGSYRVLFVSLAAHAAQFAFLVFFENPHIERMYGQRKLIANRTPLAPPRARTTTSTSTPAPTTDGTSTPTGTQPTHARSDSSSSIASSLASSSSSAAESGPEPETPSATEGETAPESDAPSTDADADGGAGAGTETEYEDPALAARKAPRRGRASPPKSGAASPKLGGGGAGKKRFARSPTAPASQHDLLARYFRKDALLLRNVDPLRTADLQLCLAVAYPLAFALAPAALAPASVLGLYAAHALAWTLWQSFGLGALLQAQSESKFLVRHFMENYHYPAGDGGKGAVAEAFANWKQLYNLSMCMTYVSFVALAWKTYSIPTDWTVGIELLRHTMGVLLIGLHIWANMESFEVLGVFGWFFGDFFMEEFPASLEYTGIYRYLNNPEIMNVAAFFGLALISGSKLVFALAVVRHLSHWWFLRYVEYPHMRKLYGDSLRPEAGFVKVIKKVARKNAAKLERPLGRHAPALKHVARQVQGTFDRVVEETADAVEEFLARSRPRISEVVQDTKVLLQSSRERLVITRVASDLSMHDANKYKIAIQPLRPDGSLRFHLGEPIKVTWRAPLSHSRRDWIGIYRVGANQSKLVTKTASFGMWLPVHDEEWEGDVPIPVEKRKGSPTRGLEQGELIFQGGTLPWQVGKYEIRYHHDGKYNVMDMIGPFEVYVDRPATLDFASVHDTLLHIVALCLDQDPSLLPLSAKAPAGDAEETTDGAAARDPDDFQFWSERQARRIAVAIREAFDIEYAPEVIMAYANVSALANRILGSKEILSP